MITKKLQNLSDKLTGGHTSAHEISKQVDYIEKNYSGGGSGGSGGGGIPEIILSVSDPNSPDNMHVVEGITADDIKNGTTPPAAIIVIRTTTGETLDRGTFYIKTMALPSNMAVYETITCYNDAAIVLRFGLLSPDTDEIEVNVEPYNNIFNTEG